LPIELYIKKKIKSCNEFKISVKMLKFSPSLSASSEYFNKRKDPISPKHNGKQNNPSVQISIDP